MGRASRRCLHAALIALAASRCAPSALGEVRTPGGADWIALAILGSGDEVLSVSALTRADRSLTYSSPLAEGARRVLLGYADDAIRLVAGDRDEPIRLELGCRNALPPPVWVLEEGGEGWMESRVAPALSLAIDARPGAPPTADSVQVQRLCVGEPKCQGRLVPSESSVRVELDECEPAAFEIGTGAGGWLCVAPQPALAECSRHRGDSPGSIELVCPTIGCTLDLRPRRTPGWPVARARVLDVPPVTPSCLGPERGLFPGHFHLGYLHDLLISGEEILVVSHFGERADTICDDRPCSGPVEELPPSQIHVFDADLRLIDTGTAPPCLSALVRDEERGGFFGLFRDGPPFERAALPDCRGQEPCGFGATYQIGRFDRRGALLQRGSHLPRTSSVSREVFPVDLLRSGDRLVAVVEADMPESDLDSVVQVAAFGVADLLAAGEPLTFRHAETGGADVLSDGLIALGDQLGSRIALVHVDAAGLREVPGPPIGGRPHLVRVLEPAAMGVEVVAMGLIGRATFATRDVRIAAREPSINGKLAAVLVDAARSSPASMLISVAAPGPTPGQSRLGQITRLDLLQQEFSPELLEIGLGPPIELHLDREGHVFGLLPWTGEIFRIDAPQ
ncbi:MAG: hypothetical protein IT384_10810 [Deltaproteobacteria bacterium]|nr:hypothetical protein [Deltaproteobacteria bacterium]